LEWERQARGWLLDGEIRGLSVNTLAFRRLLLEKFAWWLDREGISVVDALALREFVAYVSKPQPEGRWGNKQLTGAPRPKTVCKYRDELAALTAYLTDQSVLDVDPMASIPKVQVPRDQIQPFTADQVRALVAAARRQKRRPARRDEALVLFLLDTGCRVSEAVEMSVGDLDLTGRRCVVRGKGNKTRTLAFGPTTARALLMMLSDDPRAEEDPLWMARGGEGLTRYGIALAIRRLGRAAGVVASRCSPHTFRHTFAVTYLRNGGDVFTLKELLGHTDLEMVNRYLALAQADVEAQHRRYSPVEGFLGRKR